MTNPTTNHHLHVEGVIDALIGRRLRRAREAQQMTIQDLEALTGYSAEELEHYESAELCIPVQRAVRLAQLLEIDLVGPFRVAYGAAVTPQN